MGNIVHSNITQHQFNFDALAIMPVPKLAEIGIEITPILETQEYWWSELEHIRIPRKPGIYAIVNMINAHFYIGSAVSLYRRKNQHFNDLKANRHGNDHLQKAYKRYGNNAFRFYVIECVEATEDLIEREQNYIDTLDPHYNIAPTAGSQLGMKHSEETRRKLSKSHKGHIPSEETRKKRSEAQKGKKRGAFTEEWRKNMSEAHKGQTLSPVSIEKREATKQAKRETDPTYGKHSKPSPKKGKPLSEEHKAKVSATLKGYKHTEEARRNMGESKKGNTYAKGYKYTEEERKNLSELLKGNTRAKGNKGKPKSSEAIAKRTATRKAKSEADPTYGKRNRKGRDDQTD